MCLEISANIRLIQLDVFTYAGEKVFSFNKGDDGLIRFQSEYLEPPHYYRFRNGWAEPANNIQTVEFKIETQCSQIFLQAKHRLGFHVSGISPLNISSLFSKFNDRKKSYQEILESGPKRDFIIIPVIFRSQDVQMVGDDAVVVNTFGIPSPATFLEIYRLAYDYAKESIQKAIDMTADMYSQLYPKIVREG